MSSDKPILTISIAAKLLSLHPRTLMIYEKEGIAVSTRTNTGRRLYSVKDLDHIQFVSYLTQKQGTNLKGARIILSIIETVDKQGIDLKKILFSDFKAKKLI